MKKNTVNKQAFFKLQLAEEKLRDTLDLINSTDNQYHDYRISVPEETARILDLIQSRVLQLKTIYGTDRTNLGCSQPLPPFDYGSCITGEVRLRDVYPQGVRDVRGGGTTFED
jgi:hypothetical protein